MVHHKDLGCEYGHVDCCGEKMATAFAKCIKSRDGSLHGWSVSVADIHCPCWTKPPSLPEPLGCPAKRPKTGV